MRRLLMTVLSFTCISCGVSTANPVDNKANKIEIIKFMQSVNTYPAAIYEKTFWSYPEEHAKLEISINQYGNFLEEIKKLPTDDGEKFGLLKYAFLVKKGKDCDTIYADDELKTWNFMINGKRESHYDGDGSNAEDLRHRYSFFKECW